jgi:hypothetical protein
MARGRKGLPRAVVRSEAIGPTETFRDVRLALLTGAKRTMSSSPHRASWARVLVMDEKLASPPDSASAGRPR